MYCAKSPDSDQPLHDSGPRSCPPELKQGCFSLHHGEILEARLVYELDARCEATRSEQMCEECSHWRIHSCLTFFLAPENTGPQTLDFWLKSISVQYFGGPGTARFMLTGFLKPNLMEGGWGALRRLMELLGSPYLQELQTLWRLVISFGTRVLEPRQTC